MKRLTKLAAIGAGLALALTGCSSPTTTPPAQAGPVKISFWHSASGAPAELLTTLVSDFNKANEDKIEVEAIYQGAYNDALAKLVNAVSSTGIPDVMQITDTQTGFMVDSGLTTPVEKMLTGADADVLDDIVPVAKSYYTVDGALQAMPFQVSVPVIYANKALLAEAGLDADNPFKTTAELGEWVKTIHEKTGKAGLTLGMNSFWLEELTASAGELYCTPGNSMNEAATAVNYATDKQVAQWTIVQDLVASKALMNVGQAGSDAQNAFGNQSAAMVMLTSGNLGNISRLLPDGFVVLPFPKDDPNGGIVPSGNAVWLLTKDKTDASKAASAKFVAYLGSPEVQAQSFAKTGYLPNSNAAIALAEPNASVPGQAILKMFLAAKSSDITSGCHSGAMPSLRSGAAQPAIDKIVAGTDVKTALQEAEAKGKDLIAEYNQRAGK